MLEFVLDIEHVFVFFFNTNCIEIKRLRGEQRASGTGEAVKYCAVRRCHKITKPLHKCQRFHCWVFAVKTIFLTRLGAVKETRGGAAVAEAWIALAERACWQVVDSSSASITYAASCRFCNI